MSFLSRQSILGGFESKQSPDIRNYLKAPSIVQDFWGERECIFALLVRKRMGGREHTCSSLASRSVASGDALGNI